jgi:hypothetical protein
MAVFLPIIMAQNYGLKTYKVPIFNVFFSGNTGLYGGGMPSYGYGNTGMASNYG